ncbi:FtsX-like permease family protein [Pinibacter soli]|uniref:FtsX-like permease family protein n=1 Tax=Pinibacter soli TaxID=3044211 RepID=A0ABT6RIE5_9BACT|nr:FtsX-like permease family protein [Pinibacter soli]MDI3322342.1 FtsX-like permease family protein [Pinibacter soli]
MNFLFAWRYFRSKKSTNAINIIAWISVLAIMVGTASFIVVLSVYNGFEDLVKSLYASFYTDLKVVPVKGKTIIFTPEELAKIKTVPGVNAYSLNVEEKALMRNGDWQSLVYLKGVDSDYTKVTSVKQHVRHGSYETGTADKPVAVLGIGIENALALEAEKALLPLTVYLPKKGINIDASDPMQSLVADNVSTSGSFAIQEDFDNKYVITNIGFMQRMLNLQPDEYSSAEISLNAGADPDKVKHNLKTALGNKIDVITRYEQNKTFFSAMQLEKWIIYGVLSLILTVAAFTMIGALTMLVLEKQKDIQILKALGTTDVKVQGIFLSEGLLLACVGGVGGVLLAVIICWAQEKFKIIALEGGSFVIDHYPVKLYASDVLLVLFTVIIVALLASWFPSRKASLQPIELR